MAKLPVGATSVVAFDTLRLHARLLLKFALLPFVLAVAIELALMPQIEQLDAGPTARESLRILASLASLAVRVSFILLSYRLFLLGPAAVAGAGLFRFGRDGARLFVLLVAVVIVADLPFQREGAFLLQPQIDFMALFRPLLTRIHDNDESVALAVFSGAMVCYWPLSWALVLRVAFVFPVISLGEDLGLTDRWREMRGNAWRFAGAIIRTSFPVILIAMLFGASNKSYPEFLEYLQATPFERPAEDALQLAKVLLEWLAGFVLAALWAAVTTSAYARLTGFPAKGLAGQDPQPA